MDDFKDKVAVITGAASGIGFALARQACQEGMNLVLADIDKQALRDAYNSLKETGANVLSIPTDVGDPDSVEALAETCFSTFDTVHLLCNNAGITTPADNLNYAWNVPHSDWFRMIQVNMWGVINGCRSFIPRMIAKGHDGHILNTASIGGLLAGGTKGLTIYGMIKHAVVNLSESLSKQFDDSGLKLCVSVLCPSLVATRLFDTAFDNWTPSQPEDVEEATQLKDLMDTGTDPAQIAAYVFQALRRGWLYIVPHANSREGVQKRFDAIMGAFDEQHRY